MRSMSRAGRLRSAVAALAVAGLAAGTAAVMTGGSTAGAAPVHLTLDYSCVFPLIGAQPMTVEMNSEMPTSIPAGTPTGAFMIDAVATVNEGARAGLRTVGATTLEGTVKADAHLSVPTTELPLVVDLDIPQVAIPATAGPFPTNAHGSTPSLTFTNAQAGTGVISVGDLVLTITPRDANGQPTGLGTFDSECTVVPGQNQVMHTFQITTSGSTTSSSSTSSSSTSSSSTSSSSTSSSTSSSSTSSTTRPTTTTTAPQPIDFKFNIAGSSFIKAPNGTVPINGNIVAHFDLSTGKYTAELTLNPTSGNFNILGFLPVVSDIKFEQTAATTGTLIDGKLTSSSKMNVFLTNVATFGLPIGGGPNCKTVTPSTINLASPSGEIFNPLQGGKLVGTYDLAGLNDQCGFLGGFISFFMAGGGNTIELNLTKAA